MPFFRGTVAWSNQSLSREIGVPCPIWLGWPGDMVRDILWAGSDPGVTGVSSIRLPDQPSRKVGVRQTATD